MNVRPDAWRKAFRSPQVILSLLALAGAIVAVLLTRPEPVTADPFELPAVPEQTVTAEEVRIITYDRFNLEVPVRLEVNLPAGTAGQIRALLAAVQGQLSGENGAWPADLPLPVVFLTSIDGEQVVVLDLKAGDAQELTAEQLLRIRMSIEHTLREAGFGRVVLLVDGEEAGAAEAAPAEPDTD